MPETDGASSQLHDDESLQLKLASEKATYRQSIAESQKAEAEASSSLVRSLIPSPEGVPTGEVVLGENAGALGPWRAHMLLGEMASQIVETVADKLHTTKIPATTARHGRTTNPYVDASQDTVAHHGETTPTPGLPADHAEAGSRVLVTDQLGLLQGDLVARQVDMALRRMAAKLLDLRAGISSGPLRLRTQSTPTKPRRQHAVGHGMRLLAHVQEKQSSGQPRPSYPTCLHRG